MPKTMMVCSGGGHLKQLFTLSVTTGCRPRGPGLDHVRERAVLVAPRRARSALRALRGTAGPPQSLAAAIAGVARDARAHIRSRVQHRAPVLRSRCCRWRPREARKRTTSRARRARTGPSMSGRILQRLQERAHLHPVPVVAELALAVRRVDLRRLRARSDDAACRRTSARRSSRSGRRRATGSTGCTTPSCPFSPTATRCCGRPARRTSRAGASRAEIGCRMRSSTKPSREADVVIAHSGTGSAITAFEQGKFPDPRSPTRPARRAHRRPPAPDRGRRCSAAVSRSCACPRNSTTTCC